MWFMFWNRYTTKKNIFLNLVFNSFQFISIHFNSNNFFMFSEHCQKVALVYNMNKNENIFFWKLLPWIEKLFFLWCVPDIRKLNFHETKHNFFWCVPVGNISNFFMFCDVQRKFKNLLNKKRHIFLTFQFFKGWKRQTEKNFN